MKTEKLIRYASYLKEQGFDAGEIQTAILVATEGKTMAKVILVFNHEYDNQIIDGFPQSSIEVLCRFFGNKKVKSWKRETLVSKVARLQSCLEANYDKESIEDAVNYFYA